MTTYADPTRCPDCAGVLGPEPTSCPRCGLPLTGPTAYELYAALTAADRALGVLRGQRVRVGQAVRTPVEGSLSADAAAYPRSSAAHSPAPVRRSLSGASVPRILLSLGVLCLLVAAVTFLAVAWSWLGLGGRTVVLVALTGASLGITGVLHRRGLRVAAEALSVVGLGLVALDVVGARHAGWIGGVTDGHLVAVASAAVAGVALVMLGVTRPRPLVAPAVVVALGVLAATAGAEWGTDSLVPLACCVVALVGLARLGRPLASTALTVSALAAGALAWLGLVAAGLADRAPYTLAHLWGGFAVSPLLVAVATMALVAPAVGLGRRARELTAGVAALLATYVVVLAALDNSQTAATGALLAAVAVWTVAVAGAPTAVRRAATLPLVGTLPLPVASFAGLAGAALESVARVGEPFSQPAGVHVVAEHVGVAPWLTVVTAVALAAAGCALASVVVEVRRTTWAGVTAGGLLVGGVLALPLYDVPLALVVGIVAAVAVVSLLVAERLAGPSADLLRVVAAGILAAATLASLPNEVITTVVLAVATTAAVLLMSRSDATAEVASGLAPLAFAGLAWSAGEVAGVPEVWRAAPVLLVLGAVAILRPRVVFEAFAGAAGLVIGTASVVAAHDLTWALALHLTLAGTLVTTSSLVHPARRPLAWVGGLLLAMATWVRLYDLGVHAPEAYTLPSALVLVALGTWRVARDREVATFALMGPGLTLATVPSLLVALHDPFSLRAVLLGAGCLVLVLTGVRLRWSAPLVVGALVGAVLVLRELAPYAAAVPPWLLIGLSGTLLTVVGVTWESRMRDVRSATAYVGRLR